MQDLRKVYAPRLGLPKKYDPSIAKIRKEIYLAPFISAFLTSPSTGVTNNVITSQVASGLVVGLFPSKSSPLPVLIQSRNYDSLEPKYLCNRASSIRSDITVGCHGQPWKTHLTRAAAVFDKLDKVSGFPKGDDAGWHDNFDQCVQNFTSRFLIYSLRQQLLW